MHISPVDDVISKVNSPLRYPTPTARISNIVGYPSVPTAETLMNPLFEIPVRV